MPGLDIGSPDLVFDILEPQLVGDEILLSYRLRRGDDVVAQYVETVGLPPAPTVDLHRLPYLLALVASLSYYKAHIAPTIRPAFGLTDAEAHFFAETIRNGLSEFAYRNNVPVALTPRIAAASWEGPITKTDPLPTKRRALVAVGGGKDSIVTLTSIRDVGLDQVLFSVNDYLPIRRTAAHANLPLIQATRRLDPLLFQHNAAGALNGHVPVTAINSVIACIVAMRNGFTDVVFSNEASASAGNLVWEGVDVNHQWSKGVAFEGLLRDQLVGTGVDYFSLLRPFTELAIMRRFASLEDFHGIFTSCNRAFHLDPELRRSWCGECPKCRFVALMLAPFVSRAQLVSIFNKRDLLAEEAQREGFLDLLNIDGRIKPFECVGEPDECQAALHLLTARSDYADLSLLGYDTFTGNVDRLLEAKETHFIPAAYLAAAHAIH